MTTLKLENHNPVDVIYVDFAKAFDKVPHERLLIKLKHFGINGDLHLWLSSYLKNRFFQVKVGNTLSSTKSAVSGVPQRSVLGPILFLIFFSDLSSLLTTKSSLYANDLKFYGNPTHTHQTLQTNINRLSY